MRGAAADVRASDRLAYAAARAVAPGDVLGTDRALLPRPLTRDVAQRDLDRVLALVVHGESCELDAVVGGDAARAVHRGLGEVVEHARLVDDQVRELADVVGVVGGPRGADDLVRPLGVRAPEVHPADVVGLRDDALGEAERLERLDAPRLDAVCLAEHQAALALLDDARRDIGVLRHLGGEQHAGGAGADDQHIDLVGDVCGPLSADACGILHTRVS